MPNMILSDNMQACGLWLRWCRADFKYAHCQTDVCARQRGTECL